MTLNPGQFNPGMMPKKRVEREVDWSLTPHAAKQATAKGWSPDDLLSAAREPHTTYENGRYPGQMRHIRGNLVAVVDPASKKVITAYENVTETDLRPDQTDRDAQNYGRRRRT